MPLNLKGWKRDWTLMSVFFNGEEISSITERLNNLKVHTVVFCSFENRFARSGGLSAVITNVLPYIREVNHIPSVILMSPFHRHIADESNLTPTGHSFEVRHNGKTSAVDILEYTADYSRPVKGDVKEYYLKADGFFDARNRLNDPYLYDSQDEERNNLVLCQNSLFFCKAVPLALNSLRITENIILHMHEWQTALIALTAKDAMLTGALTSCGTVQTIHNSYDSTVPPGLLSNLVDSSRRKRISGLPADGLSAYEIGLQLVDGPVTTVSEHFARELTSDILQTEYYAPHLQTILKRTGVYGVNNGMFVELSSDYPKGEHHTLDEVRRIKLKNRRALLKVLSAYRPPERFGDLTYQGKTISRLPDKVPVLAMSGRLDPIQKGFFVFLRAIERFPEDAIKVVLTPLAAHSSDLDYFYEVACKCRGNVTVFPVRMTKGYHELQTGASFGIMPSIYEPFGAAVEYMASGTVNIGRATGGLVDQIDEKCGFLFKEDAVFCTARNVHDFINTEHIIQVRKINPWAQNMADNLFEVIRKAVDIYQNRPAAYYRMILNGFKKAGQFSWESNAAKYNKVYERVSRG